MRAIFIVVVVAGLLSAQSVHAGLLTDDITFQNTTTYGGTVTGSFTYNDSGTSPFTVTSITLSDSYIAGTVTEANPSLFFDGTSLTGAVSATQLDGMIPHEGNLYEGLTGTFSSLSNSLQFTFGLSEYTFVTDTVTGPVTITPDVSAVPEPATILLGATAAVILGGLTLRGRKA